MIKLYLPNDIRGDLMKKIVGPSIIAIIEIMVGTLFILGFVTTRTVTTKNAVVENNNLSKMADAVNVMFDEEAAINEAISDVEEEIVEEEIKEDIKEENIEKKVSVEEPKKEVVQEEKKEQVVEVNSDVIATYTGTLTGYGPDCCGGSGFTASGYNAWNGIYYNDSQYGSVRIVAGDKSLPFYSIVRISNVPGMDPFYAIMLDTGGSVGFGKAATFDLLFESESVAMGKTYGVTFELVRRGA